MSRNHPIRPEDPVNAGASPSQRHGRRRWLRRLAIGGTAAALLAGGGAFVAHAHGGPDGPFPMLGGPGPMGRSTAFDPDEMRARAEWSVERMLKKVDATDAQTQRIKQIVGTTLRELEGLHAQHRANRDAMTKLLAADTIDRAQLEAVRAAEMQLADQASKRMTQSVADAAEVLTAAQRAKLVDLMGRHRG
ncbi:MAG: Spy/CpxP family protein refolding chaperone [Burkholderiales bacterium]|jgi:Spy/CpxP family protein refolding chaperone|nr:Spy/CpxP family protein refolding chaperone [Burkholderiales bacterium]